VNEVEHGLFTKDASMGTEAPTPVVIPVHCAPKKAPGPKCGKPGLRKRTVTRTVRTVASKTIAYLEVTYGEYQARCDSRTSFRNTPEGVLPKAKYDNNAENRGPKPTYNLDTPTLCFPRKALARCR
jgi:hypothetical protein